MISMICEIVINLCCRLAADKKRRGVTVTTANFQSIFLFCLPYLPT